MKTEIPNLPPISQVSSEPQISDLRYVNPEKQELSLIANPPQADLHNPQVNPTNTDLLPSVKHKNLVSSSYVNLPFPDLAEGKSEESLENVNELDILIRQLKQTKLTKTNRRIAFEPVIQLTENLLNDNHSGAMFYKVLNILYPERLDLYLAAVRIALDAAEDGPQVNQGAVFVRALRDLAEEAGVDLGLKQSIERDLDHPEGVLGTQVPPQEDYALPPLAPPSLNEAIWSETQALLRPQMTKATYDAVIQGTKLMGRENGNYVVGVSTEMAHAWLENRLRDIVRRALSTVIGVSVNVEFRLTNGLR
jgi:hypothetical protein